MNIHHYLESGVLELYALNQLSPAEKAEVEAMAKAYPEVQRELRSIQLTFSMLGANSQVSPPARLKNKILSTLFNLEKEKHLDLDDLPLISRHSDYEPWLKAVAPLLPVPLENGRFVRILQKTPELTQVLLASSTDFEAEIHDDLHESFLILEGRCKCLVGDHSFFLEAGGFTEIPLHVAHSVEIVSARVVAVLQRVGGRE